MGREKKKKNGACTGLLSFLSHSHVSSETGDGVNHFVPLQRLPRVFFEDNEAMCLYCRNKIGDRDGVLSDVRLHEVDILINYAGNNNDNIDNRNFLYNIDNLFNYFSGAA